MTLRRGRREPERTVIVSIRLTPDELDSLNELVELSGTPASSIMRYAIFHYVHREIQRLKDAA